MAATSGQGATPASPIDLTVDPVPQLQLRRSEKWTGHGPDVIASTIAEMDFPVAAPIVEALYAAAGRHDLGYTSGSVPELAEAFAGFAARRMNWTSTPDRSAWCPT